VVEAVVGQVGADVDEHVAADKRVAQVYRPAP
jgi:hypothetical protein